MKNQNEIKSGLNQFYGTECYHRFSVLFRNLVLTDGAKYLADECQCYWLFDIIGSILIDGKIASTFKHCSPVVVSIKKTGSRAVVTCGSENAPIYTQEIEYTDFPLDEYDFLVGYNGDNLFVAMLFSEN